jgi:hypothetical protein
MHIACHTAGKYMHPPNTNQVSTSPYKLTVEQSKAYSWLKEQKLNVDDDTLNYWTRKYHSQRLIDVVEFAHKRIQEGQQIKNIGGWIHKLLKDGLPVVNGNCRNNLEFLKLYMKDRPWKGLNIYEKYVKDETTGDDLSLTMEPNEFRRALEATYNRSQL